MKESRVAIEQPEHAVGVGRIDRVGQPDVFDAGGRKDFRLAKLGATDADGAASDLHAGEVR